MSGSEGKFFVAATPIGNLQDISARLKHCLDQADIILAEDTRRARNLCTYLKLKDTTIKRCDQIKEQAMLDPIKTWLDQGLNLVLVSDAGTPCISDPGWRIIQYLRTFQPGTDIIPIPGPSSVTSALSVSGFPATPFTFYGFLEKKKSKAQRQLETMFASKHTSVFFESKYRIEKTLPQMLALEASRLIFMTREMTKTFEQSFYGPVSDVSQGISQTKGEWTIVVSPNHDKFRT